MRPFLFPYTIFETPTYYVLYLLAFLGAILLGTRKAQSYGLSPVRAVDVGIVIFISGVTGARLFHIFIEAPRYYWDHPIRVFYFWQGGFVLFGGILVGILATYIYLRIMKEQIGKWADVIAPCLFVGIGIGRGGCLAAGCCYGRPTNSILGMVFSDPRSAASPLNTPLYPTQAMEMLFALFAALAFLKIFRKPPKVPGSSFVWMLVFYSLFRFSIEFLRGDADRGLFLGGHLATSQFIALGTLLGCLIWFAWAHSRSKPIS